MPQNLIEMVCSGNSGRSPVAELIGRNYLRKIGAVGYDTISSGSDVDRINKGEIPVDRMRGLVEKAIRRGDIYKTAWDIETVGEEELRELYERARTVFNREEHQFRQEALHYFGIDGKVKVSSEQTIARPDTIAIFTMADANKSVVQRIYEHATHQPIIENLTANQLPNAFGGTREEYFAIIALIKEAVPTQVKRVLEESK